MNTYPDFNVDFEVASYHCSADGLMRPEYWLLFCQEVAEKHAHEHGFGSAWVKSKGYLWVQTRSDFIFHRRPHWKEIVRLNTNTGAASSVQALRRVSMYSLDGELLAEAQLNWVLIDKHRRRPVGLKRAELELAPAQWSWESAITPSSWEDVPARCKDIITGSRDTDFNGHINNSAYLIWTLENAASPLHPKRILLNFRKESYADESLKMSYQQQGEWTRCVIGDRAELLIEQQSSAAAAL